MKNIVSFFVVQMLGICVAFAAAPQSNQNMTVATSARSVVSLMATDASGHVLVQNSGVVVAKGLVVSKCHVLTAPNTSLLTVTYQHKTYPATLHKLDFPSDTCSFVSASLPAPPVQVDANVHVNSGQKIYVIGATDSGLPTISSGKLTALQKVDGTVMRKVDAQAPPSAVGGGLFDAKGHLIGVAYLSAGSGEQANLAFPVSEVGNLSTSGTPPMLSNGKRLQLSRVFLTSVDASNRGDDAAAITPMMLLAKQGDMHAQFFLSLMYLEGLGISEDDEKCVYWLQKSVEQRDIHAQFILGMFYVVGKGVPKDGAKGVHWLKKVAKQSVVGAQAILGMLYLEGHGVPQDFPQGLDWLRKAAAQGSGMAQFALGTAYVAGTGVQRDLVQGAKWLMLSAARGDKHAAPSLSELEEDMSAAQIAKARQLANQWSLQHMY